MLQELEAWKSQHNSQGPMFRFWTTQMLNEPGEDYNQIGGVPVGVVAERWPKMRDVKALHSLLEEAGESYEAEDARLEYVCTWDLRPLELSGLAEGVVAVAFFISCAEFHQAWQPGSEDVVLLFLTDEDMKKGPCSKPPPLRCQTQETRWFSWVSIELPVSVLAVGEGDEDSAEKQLLSAIWRLPFKVLPSPLWLQDKEKDVTDEAVNGFLFQFTEEFVPINLGDMGEMYVYRDTAFFQCY
jgi:hypothetical protein